MKTVDNVNSPKHYKSGELELIDYLEAGAMCLHLASAVQYVTRFPFKSRPTEDLDKALWYLKRLNRSEFMLKQQTRLTPDRYFSENYKPAKIVSAFFSDERLHQFGVDRTEIHQHFRNHLVLFYWCVNLACTSPNYGVVQERVTSAIGHVVELRSHYL